MNCEDNVKTNCWEQQPSACVIYEESLPDYSKLKKNCATIQETTKELYDHQDKIKKSIDLSNLNNGCIDFDEFKEGKELQVHEAFNAIENKLCKVLDEMEDDEEESELNLDFKCLATTCGEPITSLKDLLQSLINEVCDLKNKVNELTD